MTENNGAGKGAPRLPAFDAGALDEQQRQVLDDILSGPRGNLDGPFLGWIHSPELAGHAQELGAFCRYRTGLPLKLSELAILVTAAKWQCQAEWHIHHPIALSAGLAPQIAEALRTADPSSSPASSEPPGMDGDERLVWRFACELYDNKRVSDASYAALVARFGLKVAVNLAALLGYYSLVAMTLNVFNMRAQGQVDLPFAE